MTSSNEAGLFVNDGSFLERFKQLQGHHDALKATSLTDGQASTGTSDNHQDSFWVKTPASHQESPVSKTGNHKPAAPTNGKLAFSLKQKSRLAVNPLKLGGEDEEGGEDGQGDNDRRSKKLKADKSSGFAGSISDQDSPAPPSDLEVKKVIDKLATFVAKNGRQFENITRQKNPGDTPFRFLFDVSSPEYKYYEQQLVLEEQNLFRKDDSVGGGASFRNQGIQQRYSSQQHANYSIPASALYSGSNDDRRRQNREPEQDNVRQATLPTDSVSMMEFYMKKAAQEDLRKPPKQSKDEPPPPALPPQPIEVEEKIPGVGKKGHHMGDYIPPEELEKFLAKCNDAMARKAAKATADRAKIQADNVGHRLLSKMGWKEGEGLGSRKGGRADPVQAGSVKLNNLGVGAEQPGEVTPDDDIYERYKKRMMLGYRFRPNPLNNPRKAYY